VGFEEFEPDLAACLHVGMAAPQTNHVRHVSFDFLTLDAGTVIAGPAPMLD